MRRYVMAIDPGKMSGWATYDNDTREFKSGQSDYDATCRLLMDPASCFSAIMKCMKCRKDLHRNDEGNLEAHDVGTWCVDETSHMPEKIPHVDLDLISESFLITVNTAKNTQATWSLELIGVTRMVSRLYGGQELVLQSPAAAKRLMSDDLLKALDWHRPGKGHANDAARHLGLFLMSRGWMDDRVKEHVAGR